MKTASIAIYSGLIIILFGFGDDKGKIFPSWLYFLVGGISLIYGFYLHYKLDNKLFKITENWSLDWKKISSKIYIIFGIILIQLNKLVDIIDEIIEIKVFFLIVGAIFTIYGLKLHFKEKRDKKDSGNIEK